MKKSIFNNNNKISHKNVIVLWADVQLFIRFYAGRSRRLLPVALPDTEKEGKHYYRFLERGSSATATKSNKLFIYFKIFSS